MSTCRPRSNGRNVGAEIDDELGAELDDELGAELGAEL
jgi:hypothetical protein